MQAGSTTAGEIIPGRGGAQLLRDVAIVTHCVADLELAVDSWTGPLGYQLLETGELDEASCSTWDTPAAVGQPYALLQPASGADCHLRFVETGRRGHAPPATWGWMATELLAEDVDALAVDIGRQGFRVLGGPADLYPRPKAPRAMQLIGPSGELLYFTRLLPGGSRYGLRQARSWVDRPFICTIGGPASARMPEFYAGVFGHRVMERTPFMNGILAMLCDVPADTVFPTAIVRIPGRRHLLEMDELPDHIGPRQRRAGQLPPGMSMVSFVVRDIDAIAALLPADTPLRAPPRRLSGRAYGGRRAAVIEGPVGEWLELIEDKEEQPKAAVPRG